MALHWYHAPRGILLLLFPLRRTPSRLKRRNLLSLGPRLSSHAPLQARRGMWGIADTVARHRRGQGRRRRASVVSKVCLNVGGEYPVQWLSWHSPTVDIPGCILGDVVGIPWLHRGSWLYEGIRGHNLVATFSEELAELRFSS